MINSYDFRKTIVFDLFMDDLVNEHYMWRAITIYAPWDPLITRVRQPLTSGGSRKFWWGGILSTKPQKFGCLHRNWEWFFGRIWKFKRFFRPKSGGLQKKKKKKVFTEIESDFSAEIGNSNVFFAQNQVVSKKKKKGLHQNWEWFFGRNRKFKRFFRPKSGGLQKKNRNWEWVFGRIRYVWAGGGGCIPKWSRIIRNRGWFFGQNRYF